MPQPLTKAYTYASRLRGAIESLESALKLVNGTGVQCGDRMSLNAAATQAAQAARELNGMERYINALNALEDVAK